MDKFAECPECKEMIEGVKWPGGHVVVFDHKGIVEGKAHQYKLVVELPPDGDKKHAYYGY